MNNIYTRPYKNTCQSVYDSITSNLRNHDQVRRCEPDLADGDLAVMRDGQLAVAAQVPRRGRILGVLEVELQEGYSVPAGHHDCTWSDIQGDIDPQTLRLVTRYTKRFRPE